MKKLKIKIIKESDYPYSWYHIGQEFEIRYSQRGGKYGELRSTYISVHREDVFEKDDHFVIPIEHTNYNQLIRKEKLEKIEENKSNQEE